MTHIDAVRQVQWVAGDSVQGLLLGGGPGWRRRDRLVVSTSVTKALQKVFQGLLLGGGSCWGRLVL
jgi:hypothetical protein